MSLNVNVFSSLCFDVVVLELIYTAVSLVGWGYVAVKRSMYLKENFKVCSVKFSPVDSRMAIAWLLFVFCVRRASRVGLCSINRMYYELAWKWKQDFKRKKVHLFLFPGVIEVAVSHGSQIWLFVPSLGEKDVNRRRVVFIIWTPLPFDQTGSHMVHKWLKWVSYDLCLPTHNRCCFFMPTP